MNSYQSLADIPQFPHASYSVNVGWTYLDEFLKNWDYVDMDPDYQRGYVWNMAQKVAYIEYQLRGGTSGKEIYWNCPNWHRQVGSTIWHNTMELVDGKQRINAIKGFLAGEVKAFGKYLHEYGDQKRMHRLGRYDFVFRVNNLKTKKEVVEWYLGMNAGGSIHTDDDLAVAKKVLNELTISPEKLIWRGPETSELERHPYRPFGLTDLIDRNDE